MYDAAGSTTHQWNLAANRSPSALQIQALLLALLTQHVGLPELLHVIEWRRLVVELRVLISHHRRARIAVALHTLRPLVHGVEDVIRHGILAILAVVRILLHRGVD